MKNYFFILWFIASGNILLGQNNALTFDGVDDYVEMANNTIVGSTTMTIEAWVNSSAIGSDGIFSIEGVVNCIVSNNGNVRFFFDGSSSGSTNFAAGINDGAWHHVAATNDNGTTRVYVDGDLLGTQSELVDTATINSLNRPVTIGALSPGSGPGSFFQGMIDEVRVWNVARTETEIQNNICQLSNPASEPNLVAYYDFNQSTGMLLSDLGPSSFNGALMNMIGTEWSASSCPLANIASIYPKVSSKLTDAYPIEMPNLNAYPLYAHAEVKPAWAVNLTNVEFLVNGTTPIPTTQEDGYYMAWWTPTSTGSHDIHVKATASNGNSTTDTITVNVVDTASNRNVQTFDGDLIDFGSASRWFYGTYTLPQSIGAYDQIIANFSVTCPSISGGCDDWDRLAYVEYKAPDGSWMELFRYITPYGVACNHSIDVTDYASLLHGNIELRMFIDTWGSGGWDIHLDFDYIAGTPTYLYSSIQEVWHGSYNFGNPADLQPCDTVSIDFPANSQKATFRVTTTGHGWGSNNTSNAAEFYNATHQFHINSAHIFTQNLWNTCNPNPDNCTNQNGTWYHNRAGWCPGAIAPPNTYDLTPYIGSSPFDFAYVFQQSYQDLCHPNNPSCVSGTTCSDCNAGYNPFYRIGGYMISFSNAPVITSTFGLEEQEEFDLIVYPNPNNGIFNMNLANPTTETVVTVNDISGKTLKTYYFGNNEELNNYQFDLSNLSSGVYFIKINTEKQETVRKLVLH
ncbi:MAG: T9SS type A sorting domain-containing protein [Aureispira sp.]|nr:T9SS type A sorting domain-containing protein [Aureispira sp.]